MKSSIRKNTNKKPPSNSGSVKGDVLKPGVKDLTNATIPSGTTEMSDVAPATAAPLSEGNNAAKKAPQKAGVVSIIGRPNAGKSTLLNRVLGMKLSIVSPKAQTTRDRVLGILDEPNLGQMVLVDTPGIHQAKDGGVNEFMMNEVETALEEPDLVWYLVDPKSEFKREETVVEALKLSVSPKTPVFLLMTKADLKTSLKFRTEKAETLQALYPFAQVHYISGERGRGVEELLKESWKLLPEGERHFADSEAVSDKPVKFFAGEFIREQLFHRLGEELPYCCAIRIDKFKEEAPIKIDATILVERESQKGMVIGARGAKIKEISMNARMEIAEFLGQPVILVLKVDVLKDWSKDAKALERLGYQLPKPAQKAAKNKRREITLHRLNEAAAKAAKTIPTAPEEVKAANAAVLQETTKNSELDWD